VHGDWGGVHALPLHFDILHFCRAGQKLGKPLVFASVKKDARQIFPQEVFGQFIAKHL
jgi:hypothetical protein